MNKNAHAVILLGFLVFRFFVVESVASTVDGFSIKIAEEEKLGHPRTLLIDLTGRALIVLEGTDVMLKRELSAADASALIVRFQERFAPMKSDVEADATILLSVSSIIDDVTSIQAIAQRTYQRTPDVDQIIAFLGVAETFAKVDGRILTKKANEILLREKR
jgi:hypothetical protein